MKKTVVAAALGECVHVAGITNFLRLAEWAGWRTVFLGPAVPIDEVLKTARREKAAMAGVSYRLTPETGERLLGEFVEAASDLHEKAVRFAFGGMESMIRIASSLHHTDYWRHGCTVETLGLEQWSASELTRFVQAGKVD